MGKLYAIIGTSGSGKSTIGRYVFGKDSEIISFTTREPRNNEVNGIHYYFIDKVKFEKDLDQGKFAEHDVYDGEHYGLLKEEIDYKLRRGDAYVIITYPGYEQLKKLYPNVISVFIDADKDHVEAMLRGRNDSNIDQRLALYDDERVNRFACDYVIKNEFGVIEKAIYQLLLIKNGEIDKFNELRHTKQSTELIDG